MSVAGYIHLDRHRLKRGSAPRYIEGQYASRADKIDIWDLEEKETDVNIAISMYRLCSRQQSLNVDSRIEQLVLISADTDMTPVLKAIREDFPEITVGIILPHREGIERGVPGSLKNHSNWIRRHITSNELKAYQFPDSVPTHKKPAKKPEYW